MARRQVNRLPPERRVADILLAAKHVFTERGYDEALISEIADRAGVVEGSIYRFFHNKRDLLIKMVEHWYEDLLAHDETQLQGVRGAGKTGSGSWFITISRRSDASPLSVDSSFRNSGPILTIATCGFFS